jgi:hypothetical protein
VKEDSPLQERELVALVQKAVAMGLPRIFCPIGHTVYAVQPVQHDDRSVVIYFLPAISWRPRLPYSVRLALSLRLSGMAIKQVADATGVSLRSAQHVSRYYNKELLELRQRLSTAPNHLTSPCLSK